MQCINQLHFQSKFCGPFWIMLKLLNFEPFVQEADPERPVLMVLSYPGLPGPEDSAPQYQDLFFNVTTHQ